MRIFRYLVIAFLFIAPAATLADLRSGDLPEASKWYFHADFKEMRSSDAGQHLYAWLQDEVFNDIREDAGIDLDKEADYLTAFADDSDGLVVVIEGNISQETEDKVMAMGAASGSMDKIEIRGKSAFHIKDDEIEVSGENTTVDIDLDSFDNGAWFTFAVKDKLIVTSSRDRMETLIADGGKIKVAPSSKGALFVLSAEQNLVQAGARTDELDANDRDWNSNIIRNTEQVALLIANKAGKIAIEAQLITTEPEMADSLASIVRGLISLQVFNDDMDPEVASFLQNTKVDVDDNKLSISVALAPEVVVAALD